MSYKTPSVTTYYDNTTDTSPSGVDTYCSEIYPCVVLDLQTPAYNVSNCTSVQAGEECLVTCADTHLGDPVTYSCPENNTDINLQPNGPLPSCIPKATCRNGPYNNGTAEDRCGTGFILNNASLDDICDGEVCNVASTGNDIETRDFSKCCQELDICSNERCSSEPGRTPTISMINQLCSSTSCTVDECCDFVPGVNIDILSPFTCLENYTKINESGRETCRVNQCETGELIRNTPTGYIIENTMALEGNDGKTADEISNNIECSSDYFGSPSVRCIINLRRCINDDGNVCEDTDGDINDEGKCNDADGCSWGPEYNTIIRGCFSSESSCAYYESQNQCIEHDKKLRGGAETISMCIDGTSNCGNTEKEERCCEERDGYCINNTTADNFLCPDNSILTKDNNKLISSGNCCTNRTGYCIGNFDPAEDYKSLNHESGPPGILCPVTVLGLDK